MILYYFLITLMPFERKGATFGSLTMVKYVGLACLVVALLELTRSRRAPDFFRTPQSRWMMLFVVLVSFSFLINGAGLNIEMSNVISYWSFLVLFFLTSILVNTMQRLHWSLLAAVGGVSWGAQGVIREWRYVFSHTGGNWRGSLTGDANYFGVNIILVTPIALMLYVTAKKTWEKVFAVACICLLVGATGVGGSRGALLGMTVTCGYIILRSKKRTKNIGLLLALLIPAMLFFPSSPLKRLLNPAKVDSRSSDSRIYGWQAGLRMIVSHPLLGVGLGNYKSVGPQYDPTGHLAIEPHIAHNAYIEVAAEMGIPVFAVFVALLVSTFRSLARTRRRAVAYGQESLAAIALAMQAGLMGACVAIFFVSGQYEKLLWLFLLFSMCLPSFLLRQRKIEPTEQAQESPVFASNPVLLEESRIQGDLVAKPWH